MKSGTRNSLQWSPPPRMLAHLGLKQDLSIFFGESFDFSRGWQGVVGRVAVFFVVLCQDHRGVSGTVRAIAGHKVTGYLTLS